MGKVWEKSGQIEFDNNGDRAPACTAYFYSGVTTTPLTVYEEAAESTAHDNPVVADGNGRWPFVSIPFAASYSVKVITSGGTQLYYYSGIPNADPIEAVADAVSDEELIATGHIVPYLADEAIVGFVRLNGRSIGSATSGATERANADTELLYTHVYNRLSNTLAAVATGRGANAAVDFAANKALTLPDARGALLVGIDTMGNSAASLLGSAPVVLGSTILPGSILGANTHTLTAGETVAHTHSFAATTSSDGSHDHTGTTNSDGTHVHSVTDPGHIHTQDSSTAYTTGGMNEDAGTNRPTITTNAGISTQSAVTGISIVSGGGHTHTFTTGLSVAHTHTISGTSGSTGSGGAHNNLSRALLVSWFIKL